MIQIRAFRTFSIAVLIAVLLTTAPVGAIGAVTSAGINFTTTGNGNPFLLYRFTGTYNTSFTQFNAAEALGPVLLTGQLLGGQFTTSCSDIGFVNNIDFSCTEINGGTCPGVEGVWRARNRTIAGVFPLGAVFTQSSGPVFANCPPPTGGPCERIASDVTSVISLDSGLAVDHTVSQRLPPASLERKDADDHGEFMRGEWAIVETARHTVRIESASSDGYAEHVTAQSEPISNALTASGIGSNPFATSASEVPPAGRYLIIQGSGHRYKLPMPLVKLNFRPGSSVDNVDPVHVVLRADFDHHGKLHAVETLEGSDSLAQELALALDIHFVEGAEHRTALFAVFEVSVGQATLISAIPVLQRCCCGAVFCV